MKQNRWLQCVLGVCCLVLMFTAVNQAKQTVKIADPSTSSLLKHKVSLNLAGATFADVLEILANKAGLTLASNLVLDGDVYISLDNVPLQEALDVIVASRGYTYDIIENIVMISEQGYGKKKGLSTQLIRVNNMSLDMAKTIIEKYLEPTESVDIKDNVLIVVAQSSKMDQINRVIESIDQKKLPQVSFETTILEVTNDALNQLEQTFATDQLLSNPTGLVTYTLPNEQSSKLLESLEKNNGVTVIAKPKLTAIHGEIAKFYVGDQIPYVTSTVNDQNKHEKLYGYKNIGINIILKPEINEFTQEIKLNINPEVNYITGYTKDDNQIPLIQTKKLNTTVVVKNKNTVLVSGFLADQPAQPKPSLLTKLPLVGHFFDNKLPINDRHYLIGVTPVL